MLADYKFSTMYLISPFVCGPFKRMRETEYSSKTYLIYGDVIK